MAILLKQGGGSKYECLTEYVYRDEADLKNTFIHSRDQIFGMIGSLGDVKSSICVEELDNTDVVLIGNDGSIFLVETKLAKNNDAGRVPIQILRYAIKFEQMPFEEFEKRWHTRSNGKHLLQELNTHFENKGSDVLQCLKENWKNKKFNLIVVMDSIRESIDQLGKHLSEHDYLISGVELKKYSANNGIEILNPKICWDELTKKSTRYEWKHIPDSSDFIKSYSKTDLKDQMPELVSFFDDLETGRTTISNVDVKRSPKNLSFKILGVLPMTTFIHIDPNNVEGSGLQFWVLKNIAKDKLEKLSALLKEHGISPRPLPKGSGKIGIWNFKKLKFSKERFEALLKGISAI